MGAGKEGFPDPEEGNPSRKEGKSKAAGKENPSQAKEIQRLFHATNPGLFKGLHRSAHSFFLGLLAEELRSYWRCATESAWRLVGVFAAGGLAIKAVIAECTLFLETR